MPDSMAAAVFGGPREIAVRTLDVPPLGPNDVLLKVRACGICGSDLHVYRREYPFASWIADQRLAPGHEYAGEIVALGPEVRGLSTSQSVAVEPRVGCGHCLYCRMGQENLCNNLEELGNIRRHGGLAEYSVAPAKVLFPLPEAVSFEQGALVEPLAVGVRGVGLARVEPGESVLVVGGGTIGLLAGAAARAAGADPVFCAARYPHQAEMAAALGLEPLRMGEERLSETVARRTDKRGVDVVVESVGADAATMQEILMSARKRGRIVLLGVWGGPVATRLMSVVGRELTLIGSSAHGLRDHRHDFERAILLIATGRVRPERIVTHRFPLAEVAQAFATADDKRTGSVKVHVRP